MEKHVKAEKSHRLQITVPEAQYAKIKAAAAENGLSVSAWLNLAAAEKLKRDKK